MKRTGEGGAGGEGRAVGVTIVSIEATPLSVPLLNPFVIAAGTIHATRAVLVHAVVADAAGRRATGLGEAAALPPVTREDQPELLSMILAAAPTLRELKLTSFDDAALAVGRALPTSAVARAGVEAAILDAWARLMGVPLAHALANEIAGGANVGADAGSGASTSASASGDSHAVLRLAALTTDITLPIAPPAQMAIAALQHHNAGFDCFKVKVGRDWRGDLASLRAIAAVVPDARFRLDANAGFTASDALALLDAALGDGLILECYEQPCGRDDLDGMAQVAARSTVPVVADESFRGAEDLQRLQAAGAAHAVNLKLSKLGGPVATLALGRRARAAGFRLMAGAMVETRVGLLAMAHVVAALGGVDWVDLDTAFLLANDPFVGGWDISGPHIQLTGLPGLAVSQR